MQPNNFNAVTKN